MSGGLLVNGMLVPIAGLKVEPPVSHGGPERCQLGPEDYRQRPTTWVRMVIAHTTGGLWPQPVIAGAGPAGHALDILDMWRGRDRGGGEHISSAAHIVVDFDGVVYCAADLARVETYHAQAINPTSIGIEMCTTPYGAIYQATLEATVTLIAAITMSGRPGAGLFPIPFQHRRAYNGQPMRRLEVAGVQSPGADIAGVLGHRDQTGRRGRGDPGDELFRLLELAGSEPLDFDAGQDLELGKQRQGRLNALDAKAGNTFRPLVVDGVCGPASVAAMLRHGFPRWRDVT